MESLACSVIDIHPQPILQKKINIHEFIEAELARPILINEYIDIGIRSSFITSVRTEEIKGGHAVTPNRGLGGFELRYDFCAAHKPMLAGQRWFCQFS